MNQDTSERDGSEPSIEQWLARLGSHEEQPEQDEVSELAAVLRRQTTAAEAAVARANLDSDEAEQLALQRLRFGLRREGIDFKSNAVRPWWAAGAVAMLAMAVTITLVWPDPADPWATYDMEPPMLRGSGAIEQASLDPKADARALAAKLHAAGVGPLVYIQPARVTVTFALSAEEVPAIEQSVLTPLRLAGAKQGENQFAFVKGRQ